MTLSHLPAQNFGFPTGRVLYHRDLILGAGARQCQSVFFRRSVWNRLEYGCASNAVKAL